jgi:hypothetical protein
LCDIENWAEVCGIEELYKLKQVHLNDDRLGRALEELEQHFEEIITALSLHVITEFELNPEQILWDTTSIYWRVVMTAQQCPVSVTAKSTAPIG